MFEPENLVCRLAARLGVDPYLLRTDDDDCFVLTRSEVEQLLQGPELMGLIEVAEYLDILSQNVCTTGGLPLPIRRVRASRLWDADEIRAFSAVFEERRRRRRHRQRT